MAVEVNRPSRAWLHSPLLGKSVGVAAVSVAAAVAVIFFLPYYATKPVFILLTVATIASTLMGGGVVGLASLGVIIGSLRYYTGPFAAPIRERLVVNLVVDFMFIGLIGYLRFVAAGRERARLAAEARSAELEKTAEALREALAAVEERREVLEATMEHIPLGIIIAGTDGGIRTVSRFGREMLAKNSADLTGLTIGQTCWRLTRADGSDVANSTELPLGRALAGEVVQAEEWIIEREDGAKIPILCTAAPIRNREGVIKGAVTGFQDLSQRKLAEQALIHSEKLAATGRLAATIAHEINNPLAAITNIVYLLERLTTDPTAREYLDLINNQLRSVTRIATQTLKFHREQGHAMRFGLSEMLEELMEFYAPKAAKHGVSLGKRLEGDAFIVGFSGEIRQVMSNLLLNALEATPAGGRVLVHCHRSRDWRSGAPGYRVAVADTGSGIAPQHRAHIFEPFFTTKGDNGTGLGLWVTAGIIQRAGGSIRVWSTRAPHRSGTCFTVFFPADIPATVRPPEAAADVKAAS